MDTGLSGYRTRSSKRGHPFRKDQAFADDFAHTKEASHTHQPANLRDVVRDQAIGRHDIEAEAITREFLSEAGNQ